MADGIPANPYDMQEMQRALLTLQQEINTLRAAAAGVEQDINAHVQQVVQQQLAAAAPAPAALGRARANAPEEWRGEPRDISLNDWMAQLSTYFESTGTTDLRQQVLVAAGCLRGAAGTWWRTRYEEYINDGRMLPANIDELSTALRRQFGRIYQSADYRREWNALKQGSKDVAEYTHQYKRIVMHVEDSNDGERLFRYVEGLNSRIRVRVEVERPRTLERAIELAAAWEGPLSHHAEAESRRYDRRSDRRRSDRRSSDRQSYNRGRRSSRERYRRPFDRHRYAPQGDPMELGQRRVRFSTSQGRSRSSSRDSRPRARSQTPGRGILKRADAERTRAESSSRAETRECFRCGRRGHLAASCPQEN